MNAEAEGVVGPVPGVFVRVPVGEKDPVPPRPGRSWERTADDVVPVALIPVVMIALIHQIGSSAKGAAEQGTSLPLWCWLFIIPASLFCLLVALLLFLCLVCCALAAIGWVRDRVAGRRRLEFRFDD